MSLVAVAVLLVNDHLLKSAWHDRGGGRDPSEALAVTLAVGGIAAAAVVFWRRATTISAQQRDAVAGSRS